MRNRPSAPRPLSRYRHVLSALLLTGIALGCTPQTSANPPLPTASPAVPPLTIAQNDDGAPADNWQRMTEPETTAALLAMINNPLGVAALNQLAIEGFISPVCTKTFYVNEPYGGFQTLLQVQCPSERGTSIAIGYTEMRVILNRFEDNIEGFTIERISTERPPDFPLPTE